MLPKFLLYVAALEFSERAIAAMTGSEEELLQQPRWLRNMFSLFKVSDNVWIRIPKSHEIGVLASVFGAAIDYFKGDKNAFDGIPESLVRSIIPIEETVGGGPLSGFLEAGLNYSIFYNRHIDPEFEVKKNLSERDKEKMGYKKTSFPAKFYQELVENFGLGDTQFGRNFGSAQKFDFLVANIFGGSGRLVTDTLSSKPLDDPAQYLFGSWAGLTAPSPSTQSRDVRFVWDFVSQHGIAPNHRRLKRLKYLSDRQHKVETSEEKDRIAEKIRKEGSRLRRMIEKRGKRAF